MNTYYSVMLNKLLDGLKILPDKDEETPENTLRALWLCAAGKPVSIISALTIELPELGAKEKQKLEELIEKRIDGQPVAYLTRRQMFMGLEFICNSSALIPRKETELLANAAIEKLESVHLSVTEIKLFDICTGMGNLACTFAHRFGNIRVYASDLSVDAVKLARMNAENLGVDNKIVFDSGDLIEAFDSEEHYGTLDLLVCNPPYITSDKVKVMPREISSNEPNMAFDGGVFGINIIQRLVTDSVKFLKNDGWLVFEVGMGQGELLLKRLQKNDSFSQLESKVDNEGKIRVLLAQKR